jgi:glutamyl-tRNA reductase
VKEVGDSERLENLEGYRPISLKADGCQPGAKEAQVLACFSLNTHNAPLDLREPFAFSAEELPAVRALVHPFTTDLFVLSTCQRFEAYAIFRARVPIETLPRLLAEYRGVDPDSLYVHGQLYSGLDAAEHLFRLAAGLESPVLGEAQILGQLRRALEECRRHDLVAHRLAALIGSALSAGRRVRQLTDLGRGALSVPGLAVEWARQQIGDLSRRTVTLIGAGETAHLAAKVMANAGRLLIVNRTLNRAQALADDTQGEALPWQDLPEAIAAADLVVCCVGTQKPVVRRSMVVDAQRRRGDVPLMLVDLSVPRGVEPAVADLPGVRVVTVEDLRGQCDAHRAGRCAEVPKAEAIMAQELERAWQDWNEAATHSTVGSLRLWAESERRDAIAHYRGRLRNLSPEHEEAIDYLTHAIVNKLIHQPTIWLKANPAQADWCVRELFRVGSAQ